MLLIAIDTSGSAGGITLAEAGENSFHVVESAPIAGGTFSAQLIPTLSALLSKHGFSAKNLDGFAAASGPGSFTGLRVGLSAIKGLAETLQKPIATVSVLEALASLPDGTGKIAAALDASRKEVFLGVYERTDGRNNPALRKLREELLSQSDFLTAIAKEAPALLITSDAAIAELASASHSAVKQLPRPGSETIAQLGAVKLLAGENVSVEALDANYLRRSDAEIFFKGTR